MTPQGTAGQVIEDRYSLVEHLGSGAHGDVWVAKDRILDELVALKWMRFVHGKMQARIRREITTLRTLRFPGIVRLIDEGIAEDRPFLVMDLVHGRPFPGLDERRPSWPALSGPTLALLETLVHVHAAGVVHRDLKPDNVLVRQDGQPVMLDFSVSVLHTPESRRLTSEGQVIGTPMYLAPEQILDKPVDARTDLYAIGVMLYEALTGRVPHDAKDMYSIVLKRLGGPVKPIEQLEPTLPTDVASVINRLLAQRPEDRFSSAADVIAALRGESTHSTIVPKLDTALVDHQALMSFFSGTDRLFHVREDAARLLFERTGGKTSQIEAELEQWVRIGLARRDGQTFVVDRNSLRQPPPSQATTAAERRRQEQLAAGFVEEPVREWINQAQDLATTGDLDAATTVLGQALRVARSEDLVTAEREILCLWSKVALAKATPRALDGALYELARMRFPNTDTQRLQVLLRAAIAAPGANGFSVLEMVDDLGRFADSYLERARQRIRITALATRASPALLAEALEEIDDWAEQSQDAMARLSAAEGHARRRYHEGRFADAAALYGRAAALEPWTTGRIEAMLRSASALLEAFEHEKAEKAADEARNLAARARHPYWEGRAEWLMRSAKYRMDHVRQPDLELVDAVTRVGAQDLEALVCLNEAAVAMRFDIQEEAQMLADRAAALWREMGRPFATMLARALAIACGAFADTNEVNALVNRALTCKGAGIGIQTLGLLGRVFPERRTSWQHAITTLMANVPEKHWSQRMDVLSMN